MADSMFHQPVMGRRAFVGGTLAASSMAFLAACGKKGGDASGSESGSTLNFYINNPVCIDPYNVQEDQGTQVEYQLFDALTSYDAEKGEIVPLACESFESNDDATEFTFKIKKAKFHNGDDVTSKSFKLGWERLVNTKSAIATEYGPSEVSYHLSMVEGYDDLLAGNATELSGVTCPDDETLVVKLSSAYADFPFVASHPALAPVPECAESDVKSFYLAPVGNGPFMMDGKWEDGQEINVKKFDDYYGDKAKIDGIHFQVIKDMETAYKEFQAGNLDVCDVPVAQIDAAKKDRGVSKDGYTMGDGERMLLGAEPSTYYLTCNTTAEPFNNADLRRGISLAINREAICKTIFKGTRTPADGIVPPGIDGGNLDVCDVPVAQIDAAKKDRGVSKDGYTMGDGERMLLGAEPSTYYLTCNNTAEPFNNADLRRGISLAINREAICKTIFKGTRTPADGIVPPGIDGYKEGAWEFCAYDVDKANEYLDKVAPARANGDRGISVTLSYNQDGGHKEIMESIIGDLAKVGVTAVSDTPEWSALLEQYQNFNYQFGRLGWIADYPIMDNFLYPLFHSDSLGGDNRSGYNNPEFDAKVDEARTIVDDEERVAKMQEADAMVAADCPVIPIMFYTHTIAGSDRIKHLYVDPQKHADLGTAELA